MTKKRVIDIHFSDYRSIVCLNSYLPDKSFFTGELPIIAVDGAANNLFQLGVHPDIIIGDMDSVKGSVREKSNTFYCPDQDYCDYEKAMNYLEENDLLPAIVVGVDGGNLDHLLNNINIFLNSNCVLYAPPIVGYVLRENEDKVFTLPLDTKISLIGIPSATITTLGLKWDLENAYLSFPGKNSCFNRSMRETIHINVHKGVVLALIYQRSEMTETLK